MRLPVALPILLLSLSLPIVGNAKDRLPDPTRPPGGLAHAVQMTPNPNGKLDLRAIFFSNGRRLAVINDQRLREQDQIGTARVLEIMADRVRLTRDGSEFDLTLVHIDIKAPSEDVQPNVNGSTLTTTKMPARTTEPNPAAMTAMARQTDSPAAPSAIRPGTHSGGDRSDPSSALQTDGTRPSGSQTPSWLDTLLGEGKE